MKRFAFIDISKGLGILLVVLGHLFRSDQAIYNIIYAFHMPLFFILSGAFANTNLSLGQYFKKNFLRLYLPFVIFSLADFLLTISSSILRNTFSITQVKSLLLSITGLNFTTTNTPIWFLFALFVIQMIYYFINANKILKMSALFIAPIFAIAAFFVYFPKNCLWIVAIPCLSFFVAGNFLKEKLLSLPEKIEESKTKYLIFTLIITVAFVFLSVKNTNVRMGDCIYGDPILFVFNAFAGTFVLIVFSVFISAFTPISKALCFFGKNSIIVLTTHYYFCRVIFPWGMAHFGLYQLVKNYGIQLLAFAIIIGITVPIILIINKYFRFIYGKK